MQYQCQKCDKIYSYQELALKCCEWNKRNQVEIWVCGICKNKFQVEDYALACCREKKVKPYMPKGVWIKIKSLDDIPDIRLLISDGKGGLWLYQPHDDKFFCFVRGDYYMIPPDLPDEIECKYDCECEDCPEPC